MHMSFKSAECSVPNGYIYCSHSTLIVNVTFDESFILESNVLYTKILLETKSSNIKPKAYTSVKTTAQSSLS